MKIHNKILWITRAALLIALLVGWQAVSKVIPGTLVTGSGVNFILIIATVVCSRSTGVCVAVVSPVMAQLFGVAPPYWILVPFLIAGNITLVLVWSVICGKYCGILNRVIALITAATLKFAVLYFGIVELVGGVIMPNIPPPLLVAFSIPQLLTASIGGVLALVLIPVLRKIEIASK